MKTYKQFIQESQKVLNTIGKNYSKRHPGVNVDTTYDKDSNRIRVNQLFVPPDKQGKGIGTRIMKGLGKYADKNNMQISLNQQADKGKKGKLAKFYKSHGFKANRGNKRDFTTRDTHVRNPQSSVRKEVKEQSSPYQPYKAPKPIIPSPPPPGFREKYIDPLKKKPSIENA